MLLQRPHSTHIQPIFNGWAQDEFITKYLVWVAHQSIEETRTHVDNGISDWETGKSFMQLMKAKNEKQQLIGAFHSRVTPHGISFGYLVARQYWGHGFMSEALTFMSNWWLQQKDVYRVFAHCHLENIASAKVMEKSGFVFEGVLKKHTIHPNISPIPCDSKIYAKTR